MGTRLGLNIVKTLCELLQFDFNISSISNKGTSISIIIKDVYNKDFNNNNINIIYNVINHEVNSIDSECLNTTKELAILNNSYYNISKDINENINYKDKIEYILENKINTERNYINNSNNADNEKIRKIYLSPISDNLNDNRKMCLRLKLNQEFKYCSNKRTKIVCKSLKGKTNIRKQLYNKSNIIINSKNSKNFTNDITSLIDINNNRIKYDNLRNIHYKITNINYINNNIYNYNKKTIDNILDNTTTIDRILIVDNTETIRKSLIKLLMKDQVSKLNELNQQQNNKFFSNSKAFEIIEAKDGIEMLNHVITDQMQGRKIKIIIMMKIWSICQEVTQFL